MRRSHLVVLIVALTCAAAECRAQSLVAGDRIVSPQQRFGDREIPPPSQRIARSTSPKKSTWAGGGSIWKSILSLTFVVLLILVGGKMLKKYLPSANRRLHPDAIRLLGQRAIAPQQYIQLVRCGSRILILGTSQQGLTTLAEVSDPVEVDYLSGLCEQSQPDSVTNSFSQLLQNYRDVGTQNDGSERDGSERNDHQQQPRSFTERLPSLTPSSHAAETGLLQRESAEETHGRAA